MKVFVFIILWTSKLLSASVMVPHCPTQTCTPCPAYGLLGYGYPSCVLSFFFFFFFRSQFSTRNKLDIKRKRKEKKKKISCISLRCSRSSPPPESQSIFTVILCGRSRIACPLLHLRGSRTPRADETLPSIQMHAEPPCRSTPPWKPERETNELGKWLTSHLRTTEGEAGGLIQAGVWQAGEHSRGRIALTLAQTSLIY